MKVGALADNKMTPQMSNKSGFIAALDQSGGSTPETLRLYGIQDSAYSGDAELCRLIHEVRVRIMSSDAFTGDKVIGTILSERAMDGEVKGRPVPAFFYGKRVASCRSLKSKRGWRARRAALA